MYSLLAIAVLFLPISTEAGSAAAAVPEQFIGQWASRLASCDSGADDLVVRIAARHIQYWESDGPIRAVVERGGRELALIAELSGEGQTWLHATKLELSAEGDRLIDRTTIPGKGIVRYRCPDAAPGDSDASS